MSKAASTFRKSDVKRAIQAAESAGMTVRRVEIPPARSLLFPTMARPPARSQSRKTHWIIGSHPMRVRLKGINSKRKRLADGSWRTYWYAWKSGPPLRGEPGTPEFIASYNEAVARKVTPPRGTVLSVLTQYQASEDFRGLADSTRRSYVALITRIEKDFGDFPLSALTDRRTRGVFMTWRDEIAASAGRRQADYAWTVLARVLSWSFNRGLVAVNPCERGGRLYRGGGRAEKVWTDVDEAAFLERAPAHLHLPLLLALWTGQRQGDLLRLPRPSQSGHRPRSTLRGPDRSPARQRIPLS